MTTVNGQAVIVLSAQQCTKLRQLLEPNRAAYVDAELMAAIDLIKECASTFAADATEVAYRPKVVEHQKELWLGTADAAKLYGVTERSVRRAIEDGRLLARRESRRLLIRGGQSNPFSRAI